MAGNESVTNKSWKIALGEQRSCHGGILINIIFKKIPIPIKLKMIRKKQIRLLIIMHLKKQLAKVKLQSLV